MLFKWTKCLPISCSFYLWCWIFQNLWSLNCCSEKLLNARTSIYVKLQCRKENCIIKHLDNLWRAELSREWGLSNVSMGVNFNLPLLQPEILNYFTNFKFQARITSRNDNGGRILCLWFFIILIFINKKISSFN